MAGTLRFMLLYSQVHQRATSEIRAAAKHAATAWRDWCKQALQGGAKAAHAFTRGARVQAAYIGEERPLVGMQALDFVGKEFHDIWKSASEELTPLAGDALPDITLTQLTNLSLGVHFKCTLVVALSVRGPVAHATAPAATELGTAWATHDQFPHGACVLAETNRGGETCITHAVLHARVDKREAPCGQRVVAEVSTERAMGTQRETGGACFL
eukprot:6466009-Amphidinium_carterae.3